MGNPQALTPTRPREFFSRTWSGTGTWEPRRLLRWLPGPRRFSFRTSTTWLSEELWVVHDTLEWENGSREDSDWLARLVAADRIRFTGPHMPGGTQIVLSPDGYSFDPYYTLAVLPFLPIRLLVRCHDVCRWNAAANELTDTIEVRFMGCYIGEHRIRLRPQTSPDRHLPHDKRADGHGHETS